ncbi:hypothetical protein QE382_000225 [Sphingobacterium zeae]|uniref:Uncharacterized protein n=1 Tax=Sphingobacterium zeae TaxID=1776859 RepID=A0ABU0U1S2_9SPHI|nr:hypothetical protein [Sphingobacterium zeae]
MVFLGLTTTVFLKKTTAKGGLHKLMGKRYPVILNRRLFTNQTTCASTNQTRH